MIVAHENTRRLIEERGKEDWDSEFGRMPRLFKEPDSIPGLTWPDVTFSDRLTIDLGGDRGDLVLQYCGRGHTAGDIVAWLPQQKILFAGRPRRGRRPPSTRATRSTATGRPARWTRSRRSAPTHWSAAAARSPGAASGSTPRSSRPAASSRPCSTQVESVHERGGTLKEAFEAAHAALAPKFGHWPIFEHCLPFDVARVWDELDGHRLAA